MNILVTGGTGFIGSHLVERLVKEGHHVQVLVRKREREYKHGLRVLEKLNVVLIYGDLLDLDSLKKAVKGVDVVFHLAAIARPMAIPNKVYFDVNEVGTRNLLEVCENVKKIVVMSSVSAVGPTRDGRAVTEMTKCKPCDVYGWSKLAQEKVCEYYIKKRDLPIVILRPPMVFGPRDFEMLRLFRSINKGFFPIRSSNKCMEFLYVENLVEACMLALKKGKVGDKYHITNGEHYSINEIIRSMEKVYGKKRIPVSFPYISFVIFGWFVEGVSNIFRIHPPFKHDTVKWMTKKFWYSDCSKAMVDLGYIPKVGLDEGVRKTVHFYRKNQYIR